MDIKTRLNRCCGKDMGSGLICHDGMRCPDCFDKLEGWREIERLRGVIELIGMHPVGETKEWERGAKEMLQLARKTAANWGWQDPLIALQQKETE